MKIQVDIKNKNISLSDELLEVCQDPYIAQIFYNRGYTDPKVVYEMLNEQAYTPTQIEDFEGVHLAVDIIDQAIRMKQKILVYGDYDVDGVTSTAILVQTLRGFSDKVCYHVPDRFTEGYGMNLQVLKRYLDNGVELVITCDCGISNVDEVQYVRDRGARIVLTDHHKVPQFLPNAHIILNPQLLPKGHKASNLSGCAMAYFLCRGILRYYQQEKEAEKLLDLVGISLVADIVSLTGENRYLLKRGLKIISSSERVGLIELLKIIRDDGSFKGEEDIGFLIAPRINAAGRMDSARLAVELFLTDNVQHAGQLATKIDQLNADRKRTQETIVREAKGQVENRKKRKAILVLYSDFWHHGIIGIAAGKICDQYKKPTILLSLKEDGNTVVGSARSLEPYSIYDVIHDASKHLIKFGGHTMAAGLSLAKEDVPLFIECIEQIAEQKFVYHDTLNLEVDFKLEFENVNQKFLNRLQTAGPYGEGFPQPIFYAQDVTVLSDRVIVKNHHHIMVLEDQNGERAKAVQWFGEDKDYTGQKVNLIYKITENTYRDQNEVQLQLEYIIPRCETKLKTLDIEFIDRRQESKPDFLKTYPDALFYYEGPREVLSQDLPSERIINRTTLRSAKTLVMLTICPNTNEWKEVLYMVNPQQVVLHFLYLLDYTWQAYIVKILGYLKYCINHKKGFVRMHELMSFAGVEWELIEYTLLYLAEKGKLAYEFNEEKGFLHCDFTVKTPSLKSRMLEKRLKRFLSEKIAYRDFIYERTIKDFYKLIHETKKNLT